MVERGLTVMVATLALAGLSACYSPTVTSCAFSCAADGDCPSGLGCNAGLCTRAGEQCGGDGDGGTDADPDAAIVGGWAELAAGGYHACAITTEHTLWCWGNNDYRQLGRAAPARLATPTRVDVGAATTDWEHVAASARHTCATRADGSLWCWGLNDGGQCGAPPSSFVGPTRVADAPGLTGQRWTAVAAGAFFTCALRDDGTLWCFGTSVEGQLGQGTMTGVSAVPLRVGSGTDWRALEAGTYHLCGLHGAPGQRGQIACWGYDPSEGRIGNGANGSRSAPTPVLDDGVIDWRALSVGEYAACALDGSGAPWCWGEAYHLPGNVAADRPTRYGAAAGYAGVSVSAFGGCLLHQSQVACWGYNGEGELGAMPSPGAVDPLVVDGVSGVAVVQAGGRFVCTLDSGGAIACWGDGGDGQLGDGVIVDPRAPTEVLGQHHPWREVDLGVDHTCGVTMAGAVYCWGSNWTGQLGGGAAMSAPLYATPIAVGVTGTAQHVIAGYGHGCALDGTGALTCWGNNDHGQRGVAATSDYDPTPVDAVAQSQLATGLDASCGVAAGVRRCWGANDRGQMGNGVASGPDLLVPTSITETPNGWTQLAMGAWFGCGLASGTLRCWGENDSGQTARPVGGVTTTPTAVTDPTPGVTDAWLDVSAGVAHACAVLSADGVSGPIWCWGHNGRGQLGANRSDGPTLSSVVGAGNWIDVAAGVGHTCGVRASGELHCWGSDDSGELGDGAVDQRQTIGATVGGMTDWVAVSAGEYATCGIRGADRRLFCWGENRYGQAGTGRSVRWTPAVVPRPE